MKLFQQQGSTKRNKYVFNEIRSEEDFSPYAIFALNKIKTSLSFKNIRTNFMKQKNDNIINASTIPINKHILDGEMHVQCINHVYLI